MPPKQKITRLSILLEAYKILSEEGFQNVSARKIALGLNCSTQPIYQHFKTMSDLYNALHPIVCQYFHEQVDYNTKPGDNKWLELAISFIKAAYKNKHEYRFIYLEHPHTISSIDDFTNTSDEELLAIGLENTDNINVPSSEKSQEIHLILRIFIQGIASISNTLNTPPDETQIRELLQKTFHAFALDK